MAINRQTSTIIILFIADILLGIVSYIFADNRLVHVMYVLYTTFVLFLSVAKGNKGWIRPYSLLVISFLVFVWMRYILDLIIDIDIISVGERINEHNTNVVAAYLGIAMSIICISSLVCESSLKGKKGIIEGIISCKKRLIFPKWICNLILMLAFACFGLFMLDSYRKISIIRTHDYFAVNEGIMLQGYIYYTLGKYFVLLWLMFSKNEKRFIIGSTIMALAATGYLMRGARGYAVMYVLMWVLFLSYYTKIKIGYVIGMGLGIIFMANAVLSYRLGWTVTSGVKNIIISVLSGQGSSLEQVFGSVIFHKELAKVVNPLHLFFNPSGVQAYSIVVDQIRGTGFAKGGFGTSFFGEAYFLGPIVGVIFMIIAGLLSGILERAYEIMQKEKTEIMPYANLMLFMTIPNLAYIGRSTIKDFIFKTFFSLIVMVILQNLV